MLGVVNAPFSEMSLNVGTINYGLAHLAQENSEYVKFLRESQKYTILDNGADELTTGMAGESLWDLVQRIQPDELILPDVLADKDATVKATRSFFENFIVTAKDNEFVPDNFMAVAQGQTYDEFLECYHLWQDTEFVDVIGIPYDIDFEIPGLDTSQSNRTTARGLRRIRMCQILNVSASKKHIHLLGMNNLWELAQYEVQGIKVRSNDTTGPFAAAVGGRNWSKESRRFKKNWSALDFDRVLTKEERELAYINLLQYADACSDIRMAFNTGAAYALEELE